jgi:hypothetical protein
MHYFMQAHGGMEVCISSNLSYMEVSCHLHVPAALPPGRNILCPMDTRLGECQRRSRHCGEESNVLLLPEFEPRPSSPKPIANTDSAVAAHLGSLMKVNIKFCCPLGCTPKG